ncbi:MULTISPECIES: AMP-binding protein [Corynebacterium]|uniref:Long-chain-fatty-acid--CoA ligase n=1 Tax=Corynebacterium provencense TaxID=1737425 RepID=A0A2Z3YM76_9CORY|nr:MULTISPECIES: AMP-binding protein [Corynebacterium]AWT24868.1 Long-chain-fatty-acid--CoA ligase [Corynebacterium provencense]MCI1255856.1 AMP-binding protein [Corynebacterium provencense]
MINVFDSSERQQFVRDARGMLRGGKAVLGTGLLKGGTASQHLASFRNLARYGASMTGLLEAGTARYPDRTALIDDDGELTYRELRTQARLTARVLASRGITEKSRVGILARNGRGFMIPLSAKGYLGYTVFLLNVGASRQQLHDIAVEHNLDVLFADSEFDDKLPTDVEGLTIVHAWAGPGHRTDIDFPTIQDLWAAPGTGDDSLPKKVNQGGVVLMSSGTSGTPKAVSHGEPTLPLGVLGPAIGSLGVKAGSTLQLTASMFHVLGWAVSVIALLAGCTIVTQRVFDPENVLRQVDKYKCDGIISSAVFLKDQLAVDLANPGKYDHSSVKFIVNAGNAMSEDLVLGLEKQYGYILGSAYGSTESLLIAWAGPEDIKADPTTAGFPVWNGRVALLDEEGREVEPGQVGIIHARTMMAMKGYLGDRDQAEETAGMLNLGDRGIIDPASGRLTVLGRDNDMIIVGGENIWPSSVSDLICRIEGVHDAYCTGVEDEKTFQRVKAYVVVDGTAEVTEDDVRKFVEENLITPAVPRDVVLQTEPLPRNVIGKVVKRDLVN